MKKALFLVIFIVIAFILHLSWEVGHSLLYDWNPDISFYIPHISFMALKDALWSVAFFGIMAVVMQDFFWFKTKKNGWLVIALMGFIFSVIIIEWQALATERWQYNNLMPIVPLFGVGLTPILQMTFLPILSVFTAGRILDGFQKNNSC